MTAAPTSPTSRVAYGSADYANSSGEGGEGGDPPRSSATGDEDSDSGAGAAKKNPQDSSLASPLLGGASPSPPLMRRIKSDTAVQQLDQLPARDKRALERRIGKWRSPWSVAALLASVKAWLRRKGPNGGVMTNGRVLALVTVQLLCWTQMERISRAVAGTLRLPSGRRRPDVNTWTCRLIGWLVENGGVWTLCNLRSLLPHPEPIPDVEAEGLSMKDAFLKTGLVIVRNIIISIFSNMIAEEGAVWLLHLASTRLYGGVPYFTSQRRSAHPVTFNAVKDWIRGNGVLQIVAGGWMLGIIESFIPHPAAKEVSETSFTLFGYLKNLAIFRVIVDIVFYLAHRTLHVNPWLYNNVHKRHHEHYTTNLRTNYHFTALDLFLESALPVFCGLGFVRWLGNKMSRFEIHLLMT